MAYTVKGGDTIYDAAFNVAGSLAGVDQLLEINTSEQYAPLYLHQLQTGLHIENGGYSRTWEGLAPGASRTYEIYFRTPAYPCSHDNVILSDSLTSKDSICLFINTANLIIQVNGEEIWDKKIVLNEDYHIIIVRASNNAKGYVYVNGVASPVAAIPAPQTGVTDMGLSLGGFPGNKPPFDCEVHFVRVWDKVLTAQRAAELWNYGDLIRTHIEEDWDLIGEFLPENLTTYSWRNTGIANERRFWIYPTGSPRIVMDFFDVPVTNQMETYTPTLVDGQVLDTTDIPVYNLKALEKQLFNSTYNNKNAVKDELKHLGYTLDTKNYPQQAYIEWVISRNAMEGFIVPFCSWPGDGMPYSIDIWVDGEFIDTACGTGSYLSGAGYELPVIDREFTLRLTYAGDPYNPPPGWGRTTGYTWTEWVAGVPATGANVGKYRQRILRIINDPDYAHLMPSGLLGYNFRAMNYMGCLNLQNTAGENLPDNIETINRYYRFSCYRWNNTIKEPERESLPPNITVIEDSFRNAMYAVSNTLSRSAKEYLPDTVTKIGQNFRRDQYISCIRLTETSPEVLPSGITVLPNYFRAYQYSNTSITVAPDENIPEGVITIGNYYRDRQYENIRTLLAAPNEMLYPALKSIGTHYRYEQYVGCSALTQAAKEAYVPGATIGINYREGQYANCSDLKVGSYIHAPNFPAQLMTGNAYLRMFSSSAPLAEADTMPSYYVDEEKTEAAKVTTLTPPAATQYVLERTGIEGYDELNVNWK